MDNGEGEATMRTPFKSIAFIIMLMVGGNANAEDCKELLPGCFNGLYNFAIDLRSRDGAVEYLHCHVVKITPWPEAKQQIGDYLRSKNVPEAQIVEELGRAHSLLGPWMPAR